MTSRRAHPGKCAEGAHKPQRHATKATHHRSAGFRAQAPTATSIAALVLYYRGHAGGCCPGPVAAFHPGPFVPGPADGGGRVGTQPTQGRWRCHPRVVAVSARHRTPTPPGPGFPRCRRGGVHRSFGWNPGPGAQCGRRTGACGGPRAFPEVGERGRNGCPGSRLGHTRGVVPGCGLCRRGVRPDGGCKPSRTVSAVALAAGARGADDGPTVLLDVYGKHLRENVAHVFRASGAADPGPAQHPALRTARFFHGAEADGQRYAADRIADHGTLPD